MCVRAHVCVFFICLIYPSTNKKRKENMCIFKILIAIVFILLGLILGFVVVGSSFSSSFGFKLFIVICQIT